MARKKKLPVVLPCTRENDVYVASLQKVYLVAVWAGAGIRECYYAGENRPYTDRTGKEYSVPLVYEYTDHNGAYEEYILMPIDFVTTGTILGWTFDKSEAEKMAADYNIKYHLY